MVAIVDDGRRARTAWIANVPIPDAPPCTRNTSPSRRSATPNTVEWTVAAASGSPAASSSDTPAGTGSTWPAGTLTLVAYPPPASRAQTSSPGCHAVTPAPTAATRPEHSIPSTADAPGGGG